MKMDTLEADRILGDSGCHKERQGRASSDGTLDDGHTDTLTVGEGSPSPTSSGADVRYLVHQDRNWNVIALSDYDQDSSANDAVIVERYAYAPYGRFVVLKGDSGGDQLGYVLLTSAVGNVFAHQGLPMDFEKGSYQNRWREHMADDHRFAQRDPLQYQQAMSLYAYVANSPTTLSDPTGQVWWWWLLRPIWPPQPPRIIDPRFWERQILPNFESEVEWAAHGGPGSGTAFVTPAREANLPGGGTSLPAVLPARLCRSLHRSGTLVRSSTA